jgi:hypothetical protein
MKGSVITGKCLTLYDGRQRIGRHTQAEARRAISEALIKALEAEIAWSQHGSREM